MQLKETGPGESEEAYLARLSEEDRSNVESLRKAFLETMKKQGKSGTLVAVGSSAAGKKRPGDIDLLVILREVNGTGGTHLERAVEGHRHLEALILGMSRETSFKILSKQSPEPDPQIPSVANVDGIVTERPHVILANV